MKSKPHREEETSSRPLLLPHHALFTHSGGGGGGGSSPHLFYNWEEEEDPLLSPLLSSLCSGLTAQGTFSSSIPFFSSPPTLSGREDGRSNPHKRGKEKGKGLKLNPLF